MSILSPLLPNDSFPCSAIFQFTKDTADSKSTLNLQRKSKKMSTLGNQEAIHAKHASSRNFRWDPVQFLLA